MDYLFYDAPYAADDTQVEVRAEQRQRKKRASGQVTIDDSMSSTLSSLFQSASSQNQNLLPELTYFGNAWSSITPSGQTPGNGVSSSEMSAMQKLVNAGGYNGNSVTWADVADTLMVIEFAGTAAAIYGPVGPAYGSSSVTVNNDNVATINQNAASDKANQLLYSGTGFSNSGRTTIKLVNLQDKRMAFDYVILTEDTSALNLLPFFKSSTSTPTTSAAQNPAPVTATPTTQKPAPVNAATTAAAQQQQSVSVTSANSKPSSASIAGAAVASSSVGSPSSTSSPSSSSSASFNANNPVGSASALSGSAAPSGKLLSTVGVGSATTVLSYSLSASIVVSDGSTITSYVPYLVPTASSDPSGFTWSTTNKILIFGLVPLLALLLFLLLGWCVLRRRRRRTITSSYGGSAGPRSYYEKGLTKDSMVMSPTNKEDWVWENQKETLARSPSNSHTHESSEISAVGRSLIEFEQARQAQRRAMSGWQGDGESAAQSSNALPPRGGTELEMSTFGTGKVYQPPDTTMSTTESSGLTVPNRVAPANSTTSHSGSTSFTRFLASSPLPSPAPLKTSASRLNASSASATETGSSIFSILGQSPSTAAQKSPFVVPPWPSDIRASSHLGNGSENGSPVERGAYTAYSSSSDSPVERQTESNRLSVMQSLVNPPRAAPSSVVDTDLGPWDSVSAVGANNQGPVPPWPFQTTLDPAALVKPNSPITTSPTGPKSTHSDTTPPSGSGTITSRPPTSYVAGLQPGRAKSGFFSWRKHRKASSNPQSSVFFG